MAKVYNSYRGRRSKYGVRSDDIGKRQRTVNGVTFASLAEKRRYQELLLLGAAGEIRNLELQPRFPILSAGSHVADYVADFRYQERDRRLPRFIEAGWIDVVEDVKGMKTPMYRLKRKLVEAQYGIHITEIL